jgi:hypothetical protein
MYRNIFLGRLLTLHRFTSEAKAKPGTRGTGLADWGYLLEEAMASNRATSSRGDPAQVLVLKINSNTRK